MSRVFIIALGLVFAVSQVSMAGSIEDRGKEIIIKPKSSYSQRTAERDDARSKVFQLSLERDEAKEQAESLSKKVAELEAREPATIVVEQENLRWDIIIVSFVVGFVTNGLIGGK